MTVVRTAEERARLREASVIRSAVALVEALGRMTAATNVWPDDEVFQGLGIADELESLRQSVAWYERG